MKAVAAERRRFARAQRLARGGDSRLPRRLVRVRKGQPSVGPVAVAQPRAGLGGGGEPARSPLTNKRLAHTTVVPNTALKQLIADFTSRDHQRLMAVHAALVQAAAAKRVRAEDEIAPRPALKRARSA